MLKPCNNISGDSDESKADVVNVIEGLMVLVNNAGDNGNAQDELLSGCRILPYGRTNLYGMRLAWGRVRDLKQRG